MGSLICELVGMLRDVQFQRCRLILQELSVEHTQLLPRIHGGMEIEYPALLDAYKDVIPRTKRAKHQQSTHPFLLVNGDKYVEGEEGILQLVVEKTQLSRNDILAIAAFGGDRDILEYSKQIELAEETLQSKADTAAKQALFRTRQLSGNKFVYLTFDVDGVAFPRVEIELFHRICPRTCDNFIAFCQGKVPDIMDKTQMLGYKDNVVHRIVRGGWIQAGDVAGNGEGNGASRSLFGRSFPDESFAISHNTTGVVVRTFFFQTDISHCLSTFSHSIAIAIVSIPCLSVNGEHRSSHKWLPVLHYAGAAALAGLEQRYRNDAACDFAEWFRWLTLCRFCLISALEVAFGRIVSGIHAILTIGNLETLHDRPCAPCKIVDCGLIES